SPIGRNPRDYGIELLPVPAGAFIEQIIAHSDPANDHGKFSTGLETALKFYSLGFHHDTPVEGWFDFPVPEVSIDRQLVGRVLAERTSSLMVDSLRDRRAVWLGGPLPEAEQLLQGLDLPAEWAHW